MAVVALVPHRDGDPDHQMSANYSDGMVTESRSELLHRLRELALGPWSYCWETDDVRLASKSSQRRSK